MNEPKTKQEQVKEMIERRLKNRIVAKRPASERKHRRGFDKDGRYIHIDVYKKEIDWRIK